VSCTDQLLDILFSFKQTYKLYNGSLQSYMGSIRQKQKAPLTKAPQVDNHIANNYWCSIRTANQWY